MTVRKVNCSYGKRGSGRRFGVEEVALTQKQQEQHGGKQKGGLCEEERRLSVGRWSRDRVRLGTRK
jgi:hypothetical protein